MTDNISIPKIYLRANGSNNAIQCGVILSLSDNMSASVSVTPIVTYDANNSFAYDISANKTYSVNFARNQPVTINDEGTDSTAWSNRKWKEEFTGLIDRWQAQTDGNIVTFNTAGTGAADYMNSINANVYLKQLSIKYVCGVPETLTGSFQLQLGSMYCKTKVGSGVATDGKGLRILSTNQIVIMTSSSGYDNYTICYNSSNGSQYGCIESYELKCGPMQPFPYVSMTISKKRLANVAPDLIGDIKAGSNTLVVNACGKQTFIVTKCKTSNNKYKITAYALEEAYRGISIESAYTCNAGSDIFEKICDLVGGFYTIGNMRALHVQKKDIKYVFKKSNRSLISSLTFPKTYTVWQILCICALRLGCIIYFLEGKMYVVDPTYDGSGAGATWDTNFTDSDYYKAGFITYLNKVNCDILADIQTRFISSIVNTPKYGDEGSDSLINKVYVTYSQDSDPVVTASSSIITKSLSRYTPHTKNFNLSALGMGQSDAQIIADRYAERLCDTQQSVAFEISERYDDNSWQAYYPAFADLVVTVDHNSDILLTNTASFDDSIVMPQKLALSTITRNFPEFTSTYEFGVMAETDFTQTVSRILNAIG